MHPTNDVASTNLYTVKIHKGYTKNKKKEPIHANKCYF